MKFVFALAISTTTVVLSFFLIDVLSLAIVLPLSQFGAAGALLMLSAMILGVATALLACAVKLGGYLISFQNKYQKVWRGVLMGAAVAYPAFIFAGVITEGHGISRSIYEKPLYAFIVILLVLGFSEAAIIAPSILKGTLRARIAAIVVLFTGGLVALAVTTFHPQTYIRPHRGFLLLSGILLFAGMMLLVDSLHQNLSAKSVSKITGILFLILAMLAVGSIRISFAHSDKMFEVRYLVFNHSIVAQKLQSFLGSAISDTPSSRTAGAGFNLNRDLPEPPLERGLYSGKNLILVVADAMRGDIPGYASKAVDGRSPNLDRLAGRSIVFKSGIANFSHTDRSVRTIQYGSWNVAVDRNDQPSKSPEDDSSRTSIAKLFGRAGYQTMAMMMGKGWGDIFFRPVVIVGFDIHEQPNKDCMGIVDAFYRNLKQRRSGKPLMAWLYFFDTHTPLVFYDTDLLFGDSDKGKYLAAVHHIDQCVGKLVKILEDEQMWKDTIFVFTSDHGEALGEHERMLQHSTCYLHDLSVPMIFHLPEMERQIEIGYRFQLVDLLPTIANLVGIDVKNEMVTGRDLSGLLSPNDGVEELGWGLSEGHDQQYPCASILFENWHMIYNYNGDFIELYNVLTDPSETENLADEHPEVIWRLNDTLMAHWSRKRN